MPHRSQPAHLTTSECSTRVCLEKPQIPFLRGCGQQKPQILHRTRASRCDSPEGFGGLQSLHVRCCRAIALGGPIRQEMEESSFLRCTLGHNKAHKPEAHVPSASCQLLPARCFVNKYPSCRWLNLATSCNHGADRQIPHQDNNRSSNPNSNNSTSGETVKISG